jgi:nucleotide-binding universal stress UspA family protein
MKAAEKDAAADAETARQHFEAARAAAQAAVTQSAPGPGMASGWFKTVTGRIDDIVPDEARLSDLVVFSQAAGRGDNRMAVTLEATLLDSSRPLLLTPERPPAKLGSTIAIAWNGSAECTRAVAAAMHFLLRAATVHILTAQTSATAPEEGGRLADYLAWHGIQASIHVVKPIDEPVGSALVTRASELGSDFMVMGGYGHSRVREMILGGVTRYIFDHPSLPVLIAH